MISCKLSNVLALIADNLVQSNIPYTLVGALALGVYGLPRYTSDIDFLTEGRCRSRIFQIMERLGYTCYHKTGSFAQFDSELGVLGAVDFMFVNTRDGKDILKRSVAVKNELWGTHPIIQPTDYIILKLMAIANNPDRSPQDGADMSAVLKLSENRLITKYFLPLDMEKIYHFADRFGQTERVEEYLKGIDRVFEKPGEYAL